MAHFCYSTPPLPPIGYRWVINTQFSDEFNGNTLDKSKWNDTFGTWEGRPPALFVPEAISVQNGNLEISSGILDKPYKDYTIYGGAVSSNTYNAHFGYYECRAKASKIAMSTTFWLSNQKVSFTETACKTDSYSQELDIQEAVGGGTTYDKFKKGMNSNTHFRYIKCGAEKEEFISRGTGTTLPSEVWEDYHIYGAWWKNANEVMFYANDMIFDTVKVRTDISKKPFDRPMKINMVAETYNWQPPPSHEDLLNKAINTAYYDWVRSYVLLPVDEQAGMADYPEIFDEEVKFIKIDKDESQKGEITVELSYMCNSDQNIEVSLRSHESLQHTSIIKVLAGYGHLTKELKLDFQPVKGVSYEMLVSFEGSNTTDSHLIKL